MSSGTVTKGNPPGMPVKRTGSGGGGDIAKLAKDAKHGNSKDLRHSWRPWR